MAQTVENYIRSLEMSLSTIDELLGQFEAQIANETGPWRSALQDQMQELQDEREKLVAAIQDSALQDREAETPPERLPHAGERGSHHSGVLG